MVRPCSVLSKSSSNELTSLKRFDLSFDGRVNQSVSHGGKALSRALTVPIREASVNLEEIGDDRSLILECVHHNKVTTGSVRHNIVVRLEACVDLSVEIEAAI